MPYKNRGGYEDPLAELGSDLSDISDVKPEDIDNILKSAVDLDHSILKDKPSTTSKRPQSAKKPMIDDPLADLDLPSSLDETSPPAHSIPPSKSPASLSKTRNVSALFGLGPNESASGNQIRATTSSDWLGLKGPATEEVTSVVKKPQSALALSSSSSGKSADRNIKTADSTAAPQPARRRVNILDDLFKDTGLKSDKSEEKTDVMGKNEKSGGYTPTSTKETVNRRSEKKSSVNMDWLFPNMTLKPEETASQGDVQTKKTTKEFDLGFLDSTITPSTTTRAGDKLGALKPQNTGTPVRRATSSDWLGADVGGGGDPGAGASQSQPELTVKPVEEIVTKVETMSEQETKPVSIDVINQLTNVQVQLTQAMNRRNQKFQKHMQELINEVKSAGIVTEVADKQETFEADVKETLTKEKEDLEIIGRKQEKIIQDLELEISRLEHKIAQHEFKINNVELMKDMEIESIKKTHEFEILSWQNKFDRLKATFEEVVTEYEAKIEHFKAKLEETEKLHKERVDALQAERMADLDKLGEFHRLALDQAASITVNSASGAFRIPMKTMVRPSDENEVTERENALMEKERVVEILKQKLEQDKKELDELIEREKVRKDERERESRRILMEVQFKEEMFAKEYDRKKEQLDSLQKQIQTMREEAIKEQSELAQERLLLAAEKARLEAAASLEKSPENHPLQPMDVTKARVEMEAAFETARQARELADKERRRHVDLRKSVEEIAWEQKDKEMQLEMRERHVNRMLQEAEAKRQEGLCALDEVSKLKEQLTVKQKDIDEAIRQIETKEKLLANERAEIAKERVELEKKRLQLEIFLPELLPQDELLVNPPKVFSTNKDHVDPKALIMRLKAEKDLENFVASPSVKSNYF